MDAFCLRTNSQQDLQSRQDKLRQLLDATSVEKQRLDQLRQSLGEQVDVLSSENLRFQAANSELQQQRDRLEDEKEELTREKDKQNKEKIRRLGTCYMLLSKSMSL